MKKLPNISIHANIPRSEMRFTTAGDWAIRPDGSFEIWLCEAPPIYQFIVLMHELTEWAWCWIHNVTAEAADKFDAIWEVEIRAGIHDPKEEAGFDRRCPYRKGHIWGARVERLMCFIAGVSWGKYCRYWDNYFENT